MQFGQKKFLINELQAGDAAEALKSQLIRAKPQYLEAGYVLPAPLYLYLERNQKFLAFRGPLHLLSETEVNQISHFIKTGQCYFPKYVEILFSFHGLAERTIHHLFELEVLIEPHSKLEALRGIRWPEFDPHLHAKVAVELSQLFQLGLLDENAKRDIEIDSYLVLHFAQDLLRKCVDKQERARLRELFDASVDRFECFLYVSSHLIFFSILLGNLRKPSLQNLYTELFRFISGWTPVEGEEIPWKSTSSLPAIDPLYLELLQWLTKRFYTSTWKPIQVQELKKWNSRAAQILLGRIEFVRNNSIGIQDEPVQVAQQISKYLSENPEGAA